MVTPMSKLTACSAELGLLLCQLLLGISPDGEKRSPMMTAWAPDLVTSAGHLEAQSSDIYAVADQAAQLLSVVVVRILSKPVTRDVKLWEFVHVLLVFMRALKSRPQMKERFSYAFHPELMAPLLNVLLRQLQIQGGDDWKKLFQPEFPAMYSLLNKEEKSGVYGSRSCNAKQPNGETRRPRKGKRPRALRLKEPRLKLRSTTLKTTSTWRRLPTRLWLIPAS